MVKPWRPALFQLLRFCIVGCLNFAISYTLFFLSYRYFPFSALLASLPAGAAERVAAGLRVLGATTIDGAVATVIGFAAGMVNSFVWNKFWTFNAAQETSRQARRFIVVNLACLLLSAVSVFVLTDMNNLPYTPVWMVTMVFVTGINFVASKYWVFVQK
ncbi:MAG: GtrA family protein [Proteobacteria bacterium]|nr:GtrA family protein [Pseudomonadota bacterium]